MGTICTKNYRCLFYHSRPGGDEVSRCADLGPALWGGQQCFHLRSSLSLGHAGGFLLVAVSTSHRHGRGFWEVRLICVPPSCCGIRPWRGLCLLCWPGHAPFGKCLQPLVPTVDRIWCTQVCISYNKSHRKSCWCQKSENTHKLNSWKGTFTFQSNIIAINRKATLPYSVTRRKG